jgi:hypothetical protein
MFLSLPSTFVIRSANNGRLTSPRLLKVTTNTPIILGTSGANNDGSYTRTVSEAD